MKLAQIALTASVLSLAALTGCQSSPVASNTQIQPMIALSPTRDAMSTGESVLITASTKDLLGARQINWTISPGGGQLKQEGPTGQQVLFTADQPGTYIVKATVDTPEGGQVSNQVNVTVSGRMQPAQERRVSQE